MRVRLIWVVALVLLVGCNGLPGSFKRANKEATPPTPAAQTEAPAAEADASESAAAPEAEPEAKPAPEAQAAAPAPAPPKPRDANAAQRASCVAKKGTFSRTPAGAFVCVTRTRDANKTCSASSQCEGACLARSGTCSPVTPLVGCNDIVTDSGGMATVCID